MEAVAEYDYDAQDDDDLTFQEGQIIREVTVLDEGWSEGRLLHNGQYGMFPNNYVEMRRAAPMEHLPPPVGEFSMLSMLTCVLHAYYPQCGQCWCSRGLTNHFSVSTNWLFHSVCVLRLSCVSLAS